MNRKVTNYLYNHYDKDDGDGEPLEIQIGGFRVQIGINVIILPGFHITPNPQKSGQLTIIGSNSFLGKSGTLLEGEQYSDETIVEGEPLADPNSFYANAILVCDDFGRTKENNEACIWFYRHYPIHHFSLMVNRGENTLRAVELARKNHIEEYVGLHFNVTEGIPFSHLTDEEWYTVNNGTSFGTRINRTTTSVYLRRRDRSLLLDELNQQISRFVEYGFIPRFFDTHGNINFKWPVAKAITPVIQEQGFTHIRIPRDIDKKHRLYRFLFKRRTIKLFKKWFQTADAFVNATDILNSSFARFNGQTLEIMLHPFVKNGRAINRRDVGMDALMAFLRAANITIKVS